MEERKHWYTGMTVDELNKLDSAFIGAADRAEAALEAVGADTSELAASLAMSAALQLTATDSIAAAAAAASSPSSQREGEREEERENKMSKHLRQQMQLRLWELVPTRCCGQQPCCAAWECLSHSPTTPRRTRSVKKKSLF